MAYGVARPRRLLHVGAWAAGRRRRAGTGAGVGWSAGARLRTVPDHLVERRGGPELKAHVWVVRLGPWRPGLPEREAREWFHAPYSTRIRRGRDGRRHLVARDAKAYDLGIEGVIGSDAAPWDGGGGRERSPAVELAQVLQPLGASPSGAYLHWERCGRCARCRQVERRALAFARWWGLLGVTPASRGRPLRPRAEPLDVFLQHAAQLAGWWRDYADRGASELLLHGPWTPPRQRAAPGEAFAGLRDGAADPRLAHPGLYAALAGVAPRLRKPALHCDDPATRGAITLRGPNRPLREWWFPSLWAAIHLQLDYWLQWPARRMVRCKDPTCGSPFLAVTRQDRKNRREYCSPRCANRARQRQRRNALAAATGPPANARRRQGLSTHDQG